MTDKQIKGWLRRRFTQVGWVLVIYYFLMTVLSMIAMMGEAANQMLSAWRMGDFSGKYDEGAIFGNAWGYIVSIAVGFVILHGWKGPEYWRREVLVKERKMTVPVFFAILCLCAGSQMVNSLWVSGLELVLNQFGRSVVPLLESVSGDSDTFSMFLYASLLAPIAEEALFRGYILRSLRPFGRRFAIFGSAFLFGLFHGNLLQAPYAFLMGLLLGYVAVEYSVGWAIGLHMFNNLVLADLLTRLTASLPDVVYNIISLILFGGCALVSLVILIAKRHEIRAYNRSEWMDRRVLKCFFTNSGILVLTVLMLANMIMILLA